MILNVSIPFFIRQDRKKLRRLVSGLNADCADMKTQFQIPSTQVNTWWSNQPQAIWRLRRHAQERSRARWSSKLTRIGAPGLVRDPAPLNKMNNLKTPHMKFGPPCTGIYIYRWTPHKHVYGEKSTDKSRRAYEVGVVWPILYGHPTCMFPPEYPGTPRFPAFLALRFN